MKAVRRTQNQQGVAEFVELVRDMLVKCESYWHDDLANESCNDFAVFEGPRPCCEAHRHHYNVNHCNFVEHRQAPVVRALRKLRVPS